MEIEIKKHRAIVAIAAGAVVLFLLWMFFRPAAIQVETAAAERGELIDTIDAEGRTRVKNKFTVTAPVSGKLKRIGLREGDNVVRNYPITEIDPNPPMPRTPPSVQLGPNVYAAKVYAPTSGRVLRILETSERFVEVGTPLLEIGDPSALEIVVDVLSSDAVKINPGAPMLVDDRESGDAIRARVRIIEPQAMTKISALGVEERRVDVVAEFVDAKPNFGDNFRVDVRIVLWQGQDVLNVPNSALFRSESDWNLFVVKGGRAYLRVVEIGHRSRTNTQIVDGLEDGETVIIHPPTTLTEGSRVTYE